MAFAKPLKRGCHLIFMIWLTLTLIFAALVLMKGNPISLFVDPRLDEAQRAHLKHIYGYDAPPLKQYAVYLGNVARGELGRSFLFKRPVSDIVFKRLGSSVFLGSLAYLVAGLLSLALLRGMYQERLGGVRRLCELIHMGSLSLPSFVLATLLMGTLGVKWRWFPITGSQTLFAEELGFWATLVDYLHHATLPVLSLAIPLAGMLTAYLHEQLEVLKNAPFVLSARGRGLSEPRIFWNHLMRVLLPAMIQMAGLYLPTVAMGTLIIESIFGWSGMGLMLFDAVTARDFPLLLGGSICTVVFVVCGYELADYLRDAFAFEVEP